MQAKLTAASFVVLPLLLTAPLRSAEPEGQIKPGGNVVVSADTTRLGVGGKIVASLDKDTTLEVLAIRGDWIGVSVVIEGKTFKGWVRKSDVEPESPQLAAASTLAKGFWPQFHGPNRDNISTEKGLLRKWPEKGLTLLWTAKNLGQGYSSVAIANDMILTAGNIDDHTVVTALNMRGDPLWTARNGKAWKKSYPGTRSTPTIVANRIYHQSPLGNIVCLDLEGKVIWEQDLLKEVESKSTVWGLAESLLIDGDRLISAPGGPQTCMVGMDRNTGKIIWKARSVNELAGYASPILVKYKDRRIAVTMTAKGIIGVDFDNGELLWHEEHTSPDGRNIMRPIHRDGHIFISTLRSGSVQWQITDNGDRIGIKEVWRSEEMDNHHGGAILLGDHVYSSSSSRNRRKWVCLDWKTGRMMHADGYGNGSLTCADGMFYTLSENGMMKLVKPSPEKFDVISSFKIPGQGEGSSWAHPVVCGGRLYIRHDEFLYAYDIAEKTE